MPYMYILKCADDSFYTGSTWNLDRRLWEHQNGIGANHTSKRLPVCLVYAEEFLRIDEAFYREKQIQRWSRKKKQALITGTFDTLSVLAECHNESHARNATFDSTSVAFDSAQATDCSAQATRNSDP
jgi:putative endonuclease